MEKNRSHSSSSSSTCHTTQQQAPSDNSSSSIATTTPSTSNLKPPAANTPLQNSSTSSHHGYRNTSYCYPQQQQQSNQSYPQQSNQSYRQQSNKSYPQQQQSNRSYPQQQQSNRSYPQQQQSNRSYPQQQQSNRSYPQQQQSNQSYPQQQQSNRSYPQQQQSNQSYPQQQQSNRSYPQQQQSNQSFPQQQSNRSYSQQQQSNRLYQQQHQSNRLYPQQQQSNRLYQQQQQSNRLYQQQQSNNPQQQSNRSYPQQQSNQSYQSRDVSQQPISSSRNKTIYSNKEQSLNTNYAGATDKSEDKMRMEIRSKRFGNARGNQAENSYSRPKIVGAGVSSRRNNYKGGNDIVVRDIDADSFTVQGTCQEIEKCYLRLTSAPDPATVRPEEVLEKALLMVQKSQKNYLYKCDQLKSIRQDLMVQRIRNELTVKVYETHARLAIEVGDLSEYNQCQSQLQELYAEGNKGCAMEFSAYNLLSSILHSDNNRDLLSAMSRLSVNARKDEAVKHALAVRAAVTSGNYVLFFRLYKEAPNLSTCLMDLYVDKMRYTAVKCISRSYRPTLPVAYIAQLLGFSSVLLPADSSDEKDSNGLEECAEWLKAHGACLMDNTGELVLDTKASISSLFMPKPEVDVAHGDATLSVNDFLTQALS